MSPRWEAMTATRTGSQHEDEGRASQDAVADLGNGELVAVAVADGHGDGAYHRSGVGADLAARLAAEILATRTDPAADAAVLSSHLATVAGPELVTRWSSAVAEHATAHPWWGESAAPDTATVRRSYGTTVVALVGTRHAVGLLQVGDGDAVVVRADGSALRPLPDDPDLAGHVTTSLGQRDPAAALRTAAVELNRGDVRLAWVATDGFSASQVDRAGWWLQVSTQLVQRVGERGPDRVRAQLPGWLAEPAAVGGDDTSLGLLVRR